MFRRVDNTNHRTGASPAGLLARKRPGSDRPPPACDHPVIEPGPLQVWVLRRADRHTDEVSLFVDEQTGLAELAGHVRASWDNIRGQEQVPAVPPPDDRQAVDLYYGPHQTRGDEHFSLYPEVVTGRRIAPPTGGEWAAAPPAGWWRCDECGHDIPDGSVIAAEHATSCSAHPGNIANPR